ncbi:7-cyano-7-deazaguanine synthase [Aureispira anguillae]|uniref:7-cyano-7-deazaguanine synthase n=1 Tax=Aureispira anguillae TaxID=2864201 RepID=A0A915YBG4_9BACT|nr:7-cyano-7-deazaguanine synthase [Aureispira anguillae]BDS10004.1 7-cyano-7-deazaguanine synthase [Aureispira anguillae]
MKYRGIIPFSGGIDSTAGLYLTLTQHPNDQFLVFKVNLINGECASRTVKEEQAVNAILDELRKMGICNFTFRRLSFDYSQLGPPPIWDSEAVNFAAATCLRAHPEIYELIEGAIADDYLQEGFQDRLDQIEKILYLVSERTKENLKIVFPLKEMPKYEVMKAIPPAILALTWSCRYPEGAANWELKRCHKCSTCLIIDEVLQKHPNEFEY